MKTLHYSHIFEWKLVLPDLHISIFQEQRTPTFKTFSCLMIFFVQGQLMQQ